ncbi:terpene synthase family protein [Nocardia terpenica]|uniref:Terpene synthase n=1 Tax=Nocardia terpenica TaxID=455432 RepID=A0A164LP61_9NOCA|nr:hypothetical protein [Nocardia terpenica]KZM72625.1 hypothetical protein AWN90_27930 [Nocardia terpenica]NQE92486.1 hypothetical protein [Nocardia terpenica]
MSTPSLPVAHSFTGIGTTAADVTRLLGVTPSPIMYTEFEQSFQRLLRNPTDSCSSEQPLDIPPIWCPLELRSRAGGIEFQHRSVDFYRRMGFDADSLKSAHDMCTGELACMWAPLGDDEGTQLLADWLMWALLFDDHYCDSGPISRDPTAFNHVAANLMNFALHPERQPLGVEDFDAFAAALADIAARVHTRATPEQVIICLLSHYRWALGAACGVSDRSGNYLRSLDEHMIARGPDGADLADIVLIEIAEATCLDFETRRSPAVRAITDASSVLLSVPTDIASYAREREQRSLESNIVEIIAVRDGLSRQEAVYAACALIEEIMDLFVSLKHKLAASASPGLHRYLEQLSNVIRGTLEWQRRLPRYSANVRGTPGYPDVSGQLSKDALHTVSEQRLFSGTQPPESIRWWWQFL